MNLLLIVALLAVAAWFLSRPRRPAPDAARPDRPAPDASEEATQGAPLEDQIALLSRAGLDLAPGASRATLTESWPEAEYEADPYRLLLHAYASEIEAEPWGRPTCDRAFMLDMECIEGDGSYESILRSIARAAGLSDRVHMVEDRVDLDAERAELRYRLGDISRDLRPRVTDDRADPETVTQIVDDCEALMPEGAHLWFLDNGQAVGIFGLEDAGAALIEQARPGTLFRERRF